MSLRLGSLALACATTLAASLFAPHDARACGGCFHEANPQTPETTVVTGHRMALSISATQTVLWDQIRYAGAAASFAWVLPIKPGAVLELSHDAWFEALDTATSTHVTAPALNCVQPSFGDYPDGSGSHGCSMGCSASEDASGFAEYAGGTTATGAGGGAAPPPITVVHEGTVGPYETVTLHANDPNALPGWLTTHGFAIDPSEQDLIDAYTAEGFDFIAMRLQPGQGVQAMKPVRVVTPGASPALPLRMVAAGTGASVDITLFVIGEGRWESQNFPNDKVDPAALSWDFADSSSTYSVTRAQALASSGGRTWLTTYAKSGALLSPVQNPLNSAPDSYATSDGYTASTIAQLYAMQGVADGDLPGGDTSCTGAFSALQDSDDVVAAPCAPPSGGGGGSGGAGGAPGSGGAGGAPACPPPAAGTIDGSLLACGPLDDVAIALTGMHPHSVWVTRLEASLPHVALVDDLEVQAEPSQTPVENWLVAAKIVNPPCQLATAGTLGAARTRPRGPSGERTFFAVSTAILAAALLRRARRPRLAARGGHVTAPA